MSFPHRQSRDEQDWDEAEADRAGVLLDLLGRFVDVAKMGMLQTMWIRRKIARLVESL